MPYFGRLQLFFENLFERYRKGGQHHYLSIVLFYRLFVFYNATKQNEKPTITKSNKNFSHYCYTHRRHRRRNHSFYRKNSLRLNYLRFRVPSERCNRIRQKKEQWKQQQKQQANQQQQKQAQQQGQQKQKPQQKQCYRQQHQPKKQALLLTESKSVSHNCSNFSFVLENMSNNKKRFLSSKKCGDPLCSTPNTKYRKNIEHENDDTEDVEVAIEVR